MGMADDFTHFGVFIFTAIIGFVYANSLVKKISEQVFSPRSKVLAASLNHNQNKRLLVLSIDYDGTFDSNERIMAGDGWVTAYF